jgi:hypothetical protein
LVVGARRYRYERRLPWLMIRHSPSNSSTMLKNPFLVYVLSFGAVLVVYQLGWSAIYPILSPDLLLFFGLTFLSSLLLAHLVSGLVQQTKDYQSGLLPKYTALLVTATFAAELFNAGGIPLSMIISGKNFYHLESSATHLHAFTFWSVFSTIRFADYLYSKRRLYLLEALLPILFYVLLVYRGPAIMCVVSWIFVLIIKHGRLGLKRSFLAAVAVLLVFYINGVIGDLRSPGQENAGAPSATFLESGIPHSYFWTYLYATAPMANFQLTINIITHEHGNVTEFIASELLPDFISKRILPQLDDRISVGQGYFSRDSLYVWGQPQIYPGINIATIFARSYGYFGWIGPVLMFIALGSLIVVYLAIILRSPYRVPCLALLNTLVVFCLFNNMIASAAMLPQLVWPLLLPPWRIRAGSNPQ